MLEWLESPNVQIGAGLVVLGILSAAGFSLVSSFRDYAAQDRDNASEALANLEEMHRKGDISEEEFRTIQSKTERPLKHSHSIDGLTSPDDPSTSSKSS